MHRGRCYPNTLHRYYPEDVPVPWWCPRQIACKFYLNFHPNGAGVWYASFPAEHVSGQTITRFEFEPINGINFNYVVWFEGRGLTPPQDAGIHWGVNQGQPDAVEISTGVGWQQTGWHNNLLGHLNSAPISGGPGSPIFIVDYTPICYPDFPAPVGELDVQPVKPNASGRILGNRT